MKDMIRLVDVRKSFGAHEVLHGVNLTVEAGETLVLIGGSGSGKSTLLRLLVGLDTPTSGEIWIDGDEISQMDEEALTDVRLKMGMVFQYSALFDSMTVGDNVAFGLREHTDLSEEEIQAIVEEKLTMVGLAGVADKMPGELSGGMKKRVGLARAIAFRPAIVFYDEPDSGLDPVTTAKIAALIREMQLRLGVTSVVVTHDMETACTVGDRIAMLADGGIIEILPTDEFRRSKDPRVRAFLRGLYIEDEVTG